MNDYIVTIRVEAPSEKEIWNWIETGVPNDINIYPEVFCTLNKFSSKNDIYTCEINGSDE